jgi:alpha-methylacyl-CoA racemase
MHGREAEAGGGPLAGIRIVELGSIGPGPFCAMLLADMGADVLRVDRAGAAPDGAPRPDAALNRGRRSVAVDLKHSDGVEVVLRLAERADALIEGYRPGVAERLGVGPDACRGRNPRLVYGRMTGWGQTGPYAAHPGHDINYIALSGALHSIGRAGGPPALPLNLVGDFGGGGMLLAVGVLAALLEARSSGSGQTVDAAMVDGSALLTTMFYGMRDTGLWNAPRGCNLLDGGAPFYDVYETSDGGYVSIGSLEPRFYANLIDALGLAGEELPEQYDTSSWPEMKAHFATIFRSRTRAEWCERLEAAEVCFAPVLDLDEARSFAHNRERGVFVEHAGSVQPAPAPRFDRTPAAIRRPAAAPGEHTRPALADWGFAATELDALAAAGAIA